MDLLMVNILVSSPRAFYGVSHMRTVLDGLFSRATDETAVGDLFCELGVAIVEDGAGRHSVEYVALVDSFDAALARLERQRADAHLSLMAARFPRPAARVSLNKRVNLSKRAHPTMDTLVRSGLVESYPAPVLTDARGVEVRF